MNQQWSVVCHYDDLVPERGAAALVDGVQIAVIRTFDGVVHAVGNVDPFSNAAVLSRGIVGDRSGVPTIASPMFKQAFDLTTGRCLDDDSVSIPVYPVQVRDGRVEIAVPHLAGQAA